MIRAPILCFYLSSIRRGMFRTLSCCLLLLSGTIILVEGQHLMNLLQKSNISIHTFLGFNICYCVLTVL